MKVLLLAAATLMVAVQFSAGHDHLHPDTHLDTYADSVFDDDDDASSVFRHTLATLWNVNHNFECLGRYAMGELIVQPFNCHKFLSCVANRLVELNCPNGQYFSNEYGICIPDSQQDCTPLMNRNVNAVNATLDCGETPTNICANAQNLETFPDPQNCTNYLICVDGEPVTETCLLGQYYDQALSECVYDANAVCINPCQNQPSDIPQINLPNPNCSNFYFCNNGTVSIESCLNGTFDALTGICSENGVCITEICANQPDWVTYPVPNIPTKFYRCVGHKPVLDSCPPNKVYNDDIGACMQVPSAQCDQSICNSTQYDGNAFPTNTIGDSTSFCYCRNGAAYQESCPTDYVFDTLQATCKSNATCDDEYCLSAPEYTPSAARNEPNSFCLCVSKTAVIVQCPLNGTFNANALKCQATGACDPLYCRNQPDSTIYPSDDNNAGFCTCNGKVGTFVPCEDGYLFDANLDICRPAAVAASFNCNVAKCAGMRTTIFGIQNDPHNFCYCNSANKVTQRSCPSDTYFDGTLLMCISRKHAVAASTLGCELSACSKAHDGRVYSIAAKTTDKSFCYCLGVDKVISLDCPAGKRYSSRLGVCVDTTQLNYLQPLSHDNPLALWGPHDGHYNCAGGFRHGEFIEHAQDCQRFQVCAFGQLHMMDCGDGNYYDSYNRVCDWDRYGLCTRGATTGCMGLYQEGEMIAHNTNTQLYFVCYKQQMLIQDCGTHNVFDIKQQMCVRKDAGARKRSPRSVDAAQQFEAVELAQQQHSLEEKEFMQCEEEKKRSVPSNCTQYELCVEGAWQRRTCKPMRYYNPEQQRCLEPRDDYVCAHARVSGLPACSNATLHQTQPNTRHGKCNSYFRCQADGKWALIGCPKRQYYAAQLNACIATQHNATICNATATTSTTAVDTPTDNCKHMSLRHFARDCGMYMMCVEGVWWHNYCGYGMYFNRTYNTCLLLDQLHQRSDGGDDVTSTAVNCTGNSLRLNCDVGERRPYPLNCSAYETCNAQAQWQRESCPLGHAFDEELLACVPQTAYALCSANGLRRACDDGETRVLLTAASANDSSVLATAINRTHFYYCEAEQWQLAACLANHSYVAARAACVPVTMELAIGADWHEHGAEQATNDSLPHVAALAVANVCADRLHGVRVAHELYCNIYYACVRNATYMAQCAAGEHFDEGQQQCSGNATAAHCAMAELAPLEGSADSATALALDSCRNHTSSMQLPHPADCTRYYKCSNENKKNPSNNTDGSSGLQLLSCEAGMYYDAMQQQCVNSDDSCPHVRPRSANETAAACAEKHGVLLADVGNCNDFYVCLHGKPRHESCYESYYFNATRRQCQALPQAPTGNASADATNTTENSMAGSSAAAGNGTQPHCTHKRRSHVEVCAELPAGTTLAAPADCRRYISCQQQANGGKAQIEQRCRNGENYDSLLGRCRQSDGTCRLENGQRIGECSAHHGQLVAHTRNCRGFYVCLHGQKIEMFCEPHERFDAQQLACVRDEQKQCKEELSLQRQAATMMPSLHCSAGLTTTHFYGVVLDDCRSYYRCMDGVPQVFFCPLEQHFDSEQQMCVGGMQAVCA